MSPARKQANFIIFTLVLDVLALMASFLITYALRFTTGVIPLHGGTPDFEYYAKALVVIVPVYLWFFRNYGLYQPNRAVRRIEEIFMVVKAVSFSILTIMAISFFYRKFTYSRIYLVFLWFFSVLFISSARYLLIQWEYRRKLQRKDISRVLLVGANHNARNIIQWSKANPHYGQDVVAVLTRDQALIGKHVEGIEITGMAEDCEAFIENLKPDRVVLVDSEFSREKITDLVVTCEDRMIDFKIAADFYGLLTRSVEVENVSNVPLLGFRPLPLDDFWNRCAKRIFDVLVSAAAFVLTSPLWLLAFILIKLDGRGPVFYFQERVGRDEQIFKVIKFRTMKVDAEKETGPVWAKADDARRTRFGNFLRRFNIDELPQIWNVLRGDMSLVGPRPERPHFVNQFRESIPRYMTRHKVKAGITGWAQVHGLRGNTSIHERVKYDLYYMENWSIMLDIEIIFMTLFAYKNAY